jgi:serine/threonine protein kinase/Tol biopolymer transport system component
VTMTTGTRVGLYEVVAKLGEGGMGEVYRARDTKLDRDVALKILPESFASDPDRLMRFEREAKTLAALNHPNIAAIYGIEDRALVMELVEGEDLSARIARGPIPLDEALPIAKQIAEALEAAHEQGIIHRDLKPANIKVRPDGTVKVLDFGLAKAMDQGSGIGDQGSGHLANSPTITSPAMTMHGVILGTAAYMSPEQAKGKPVDKRTDIWAFGCVVFEMLAGRRPFDGDDVTDVLGAVVRLEPEWARLPANTPPTIRKLLRRCLEKDRKQRLADASDARLEIADAQLPSHADTAPMVTVRSARGPWMIAAAIGVALIAAGVPAVRHLSEEPPEAEAIEFRFAAPENVALGGGVPAMSVSPDGRHVAFVGISQGTNAIWLRSLSSAGARMLPGTDGAPPVQPIWSPDSRFIAFGDRGQLRSVPIAGGPPITIAKVAANAFNGSWSPKGVILIDANDGDPADGGLQRIAVAGGSAARATTVDRARGETRHLFPVFLPDGRHFVYVAQSRSAVPELRIGRLDSTETTVVMPVGSQAVFSADHLLFWREGTLMAQPFDPAARRLAGEARAVTAGVAMNAGSNNFASFNASAAGVLAYSEGTRGRVARLSWFDRAGKLLSTVGEPDDWRSIALSPDGRHVAASRFDESANSSVDLWTIDLERSVSSRFTFEANLSMNNAPAWSPDGAFIAFQQSQSNDAGEDRTGIYLRPFNGNGDAQLVSKTAAQISDWSRDGQYLTFNSGGTASDVWVLPLAGDRTARALMTTRFAEREPTFSPDGRWIAYSSNESGQMQVVVEPFPSTGGKFQVSRHGGRWPTWRADGRELFFLRPDGTLMAAAISTEGRFEAGSPQALFSTGLLNPAAGQRKFAVARDGKRFLVNSVQRNAEEQRQITVILNWPASAQK